MAKQEVIKTKPKKTDLNGIFDARFHPIDIIIPFHGHYSKVTKLIQSIMTYTDWPFLITLVDDCSPNKDYARSLINPELFGLENKRLYMLINNQYYSILNVHQNETQLGFGGSVMAGYQHTKQDLICVMHSDCVVKSKTWLSDLVASLKNLKKHGAKMVSPKTNNPVEGSEFLRASKRLIKNSDLILNGDVIEDDAYLPMYCALFNRELFRRVGGIKAYPYGWFECVEFAHRMRMYGFKQGVSGKSWIYHEGEMTVNSLSEEQLQEMQKNKARCIEDMKRLEASIKANN